MDNKNFHDNTVPAQNQLNGKSAVTVGGEGGAVRVLFLGNSITRHGIAPHRGWNRECGMAASSIEKDYVHLTVSALEKRFGKVEFCIAQISAWEGDLENETLLAERFSNARDFGADIVIVRVGENIKTYDNETLADRFESMTRFFAVKEGCRIIMTDLFWRKTDIDNAIVEAAARVGATLVSIGDLGMIDEMKALGEYEHRGVALHPSDRGMAAIADRILEVI